MQWAKAIDAALKGETQAPEVKEELQAAAIEPAQEDELDDEDGAGGFAEEEGFGEGFGDDDDEDDEDFGAGFGEEDEEDTGGFGDDIDEEEEEATGFD